MIHTSAFWSLLLRWTSVACCLVAPVVGQEPAKEPPAKESPAAASAPPSIELKLPTAKPTATPVPVEEPIPTDEFGELLYSIGIRPSSLARFTDGSALSAAERNALPGIFGGLRQLKPDDWNTYARPLPAAPAKLDAAARGKLWTVAGTLKTIEPLEFTDAELEKIYPAAVADAPDFKLPADDARRKLYRCEVAMAGQTEPAIVYTLAVPEQLRDKTTLDERVGIDGVYLKSTGSDGAAPLFAARHLAWYKRTPLGDLGVDYALYDGLPVRSPDLGPEREALFQLLGAMKKVDFAKLQELTKSDYSVVPLFNKPETMRGELVAMEGRVLRAVPIVPNDELHRRFGVARYYEVALVTVGSDDNPLLFNLLELPAGFPTGENLNEQARIPGTYLVTWTYQRDWTDGERRVAQKELDKEIQAGQKPADAKLAEKRIQFAPLLVGKTLEWLPSPQAAAAEGGFNWWVNGAVVALVVVVIAVGWSTLRADRKAREIMQRTNAPTPGTSLNDLPLEYRSKPDFSNLEEQDRAK